jgi:hypothetical protein
MTDETQGTAPERATGATQGSGEMKMPHTWQKALEMWDAGEMVPAFQVESEGATQEQLWGAAFAELRGEGGVDTSIFTEREANVVDSIVAVAKLVPWPQMISSHVHAKSPALAIRKPKE